MEISKYEGMAVEDKIGTVGVTHIFAQDFLGKFVFLQPLEVNSQCKAEDHEALIAVKMALKCKEKNILDKAHKLFHHALALSPDHHDVLLPYGEFLESGLDYINADYFYLKAIRKGPENSRAVANHRRVLPIVNQLDLEELKRIDSKRIELDSLNKKDQEIYFQHIYHTVSIEGNTMSLAEIRSFIETKMTVSGKSMLEHNEILGMQQALLLLNPNLAHKRDITVADILEIHRRVMGHVDPTTAGTFRKTQVFVGEYIPPSASNVEVLMDEFLSLLQLAPVRNIHPIHIASLAHFVLVHIHPFLDGNGRTARLLMNLLFVKYGFRPIIIKKEDRAHYFDCLKIAYEGDRWPFYRFIAQCTEETIDMLLASASK